MGKRAKCVAAVAAFAVAAGVAGAATEAWASIPASDGTIHGCYKTADIGQGQLYVIDSAAACPVGYTELDWNRSGVSGYQVYTGSVIVNGPHAAGTASGTISCPAGKVALGGGWPSGTVQAEPASDGTGWTYGFTVPQLMQGDAFNFIASLTCATVGS